MQIFFILKKYFTPLIACGCLVWGVTYASVIRIPPAYTVSKGADGSALLLFYKQDLMNPKYLVNKGYYNIVGQVDCTKRGRLYVGGDSGIYQHKSALNMMLTAFTPEMQKKILSHCEFDDKFHRAFGPEIIYTGEKNAAPSYESRTGYTVGNGQGMRLKGGNVGTLPPTIPTANIAPNNAPPVPDTNNEEFHLEPSHWIYIPAPKTETLPSISTSPISAKT